MESRIYKVRQMLASDLDEVHSLSEACGFSSWRREDYEQELLKPDSVTLVSEGIIENTNGEHEINGLLLARLITPDAELLNIAVTETRRRDGIGNSLLDRLIDESLKRGVEKVWLEVRTSNRTARRFYLKRGFKELGRRPGYYSNPVEDAIVMSRRCT